MEDHRTHYPKGGDSYESHTACGKPVDTVIVTDFIEYVSCQDCLDALKVGKELIHDIC
jgi:hypothetical protein